MLRHPGDHLRRRRLDLGLRQRDLAFQLGIREETLANWERGQARPLVRHYGAVVRFLGYDPRPVGGGLPGRLNAIRRRLGLTQAELAARAGFDEGSLCRWEAGSRRPSRWMATRLAAVLDRLESGDAVNAGPGAVTYFDLTRWRRRPPPDLGPKPESLGDRLRRRRLELGLSQAEAGQQFGVGRVTVYRWERGDAVPSANLLAMVERWATSR